MSSLDIASVCHEANRRLQAILGEDVNPPWEEAPAHLRVSVVDGVWNALRGTTPRESHEGWMRFKRDEGWVYGKAKDYGLKTHPNMVPYDDLPGEQKVKDHLFLAIVEALKGLRT